MVDVYVTLKCTFSANRTKSDANPDTTISENQVTIRELVGYNDVTVDITSRSS
jgi:hypothetical protein